jgi:sterol desaturase/sphingolipid hydroxylase (fatty acid hydroxylase superfamily)
MLSVDSVVQRPKHQQVRRWDVVLSVFNFTLVYGWAKVYMVSPPTSTVSLCTIVYRLVAGMAMSNMLFYFQHRLLHSNRFLWNIHSVHHRYTTPSASVAYYAHPLEILLVNITALYIPLYLFPLPEWLQYTILILTHFNICIAHTKEDFHYQHHRCPRINYGMKNGIFDRLCGTVQSSH